MTEHERNEQTIKRCRDQLQALTSTVSTQTVFTKNGMIAQLQDGGSGDPTDDLKDLWGCDESLREGIQETAYSARVFELMRHIKFGHKVTDSDYTELGKLVLDDVDNYLYRIAEDVNK